MATSSGSILLPLLLLLAVAVAASHAATITVVNRCSYTVWPGALPGGGVRLDPGQSWDLNVAAGTPAARIWPRTGCNFDGSGRGSCITGDCGNALSCSLSGQPPTTLAEYTLGQGGGDDFFDLSLIDGFNVPVSFQPTNGGAGCSQGRGPNCAVDITSQCLPELQVPGGCTSACLKFGGDVYCCRGQYENVCPATDYSRFFKGKCPDAYSYAKDDQTSTFTCHAGTNYRIEFCPPPSEGITSRAETSEQDASVIASA